MSFPLTPAKPESLGLNKAALDRLVRAIEAHIKEGRYAGAQIAVARHGKLALFQTFGDARVDPKPLPAKDDTLWLLYSNTKVITAAAIWTLAERGLIRFTDTVAEHVPGFEKNGKGGITIIQLLTHQGGFPEADVRFSAWSDHKLLREQVCDFTLAWTPGSRVQYHPLAAHWVAGVLVEAVTGTDFRTFIAKEVVGPLGLEGELYVGLPEREHGRASDMHDPDPKAKAQIRRKDENTPEWRLAGVPGGGGYATARAMAAFYQMMVAGGTLNGVRLFSPRTVQYVTRNFTGDRPDLYMGMPMHRGLGPHVRGTTDTIRGLGSLASPRTFGHGGVGSSYCWGDPDSGVSFAYLTNTRIPDPWHSARLDAISNFVHTAIE
ncbi:MAG TPA: serine hydrolase domain-containing protein [Candidatus Cybelea sp.]|nr:serine hydrolase domain-containing protein [Candidatus Cybelea sp.]